MREAEPASNVIEDETRTTDPAIVIRYLTHFILEFFFSVTCVC